MPSRERSVVRATVAAAAAGGVGLWLSLPAVALAASPAASAGAEVGDPRSSGQGPGLVGDPLWAVLIVVGIALLSLLATLAYVHFTAPPKGAGRQ